MIPVNGFLYSGIYNWLLGQFFKNLILFHFAQILNFRPKTKNSTTNIAKDMGSFFGLTFNQIFFTIDRSLKLMGALLQFFSALIFPASSSSLVFLLGIITCSFLKTGIKNTACLCKRFAGKIAASSGARGDTLLYGMKSRKTSGLNSSEVGLAERTIPPLGAV